MQRWCGSVVHGCQTLRAAGAYPLQAGRGLQRPATGPQRPAKGHQRPVVCTFRNPVGSSLETGTGSGADGALRVAGVGPSNVTGGRVAVTCALVGPSEATMLGPQSRRYRALRGTSVGPSDMAMWGPRTGGAGVGALRDTGLGPSQARVGPSELLLRNGSFIGRQEDIKRSPVPSGALWGSQRLAWCAQTPLGSSESPVWGRQGRW